MDKAIGVNSCWIGEERARSAFGCREDRVRFLFGVEDERVSGGESGAGRRLTPLSVRTSSLYDGIQRTVKREGRKEGRKEGTRRRDDCLANVEKSLLPDFKRGNLFPFSRFAFPLFPSPLFFHRWLSARWPKIGSTITREFAVRLDRPFSRGSCLSTRDIKGSLQ